MIEDLALEPVGQEFDIVAIRSHLESLRTAIADPINPEQYLMASDPRVLHDGLTKRRQYPERVPYSLTVVFPKPSCILIGIRSKDTDPARSFVEWLRGRHEIRFLDQDFNDFTKEANENLDFIFGPREET